VRKVIEQCVKAIVILIFVIPDLFTFSTPLLLFSKQKALKRG